MMRAGAWCKRLSCTTTNVLLSNHRRYFFNSPWHGKEFRPIDAFGIVAAICRPSNDGNDKRNHDDETGQQQQQQTRGIIGINGKLPWGSLPKDRAIFEDLTRDTITIVGRKTLLEECDGRLDHMRHSRHCIVVSNSIVRLDQDPRLSCSNEDLEFLELSRSFGEALDRARELAKEEPATHHRLGCWVIGGERLYDEALQHPSARELHLSFIDATVDVSADDSVARFPEEPRWGHKFNLIRETTVPPESSATEEDQQQPKGPCYPGFVYRVYERNGSNELE